MVLRRRADRIVEGRPEGGCTDAYEIVCCDCGDHPSLHYSEVSPELRRVRGPYPVADGVVTGKSSTATQVIAVVIFVFIDFLLVIIPFAFLELRPQATRERLKHGQDWLLNHALQLMATIALLLSAYPAISGLVRLT